MLMKWMTKKEVMEATGISRYELDAAINSGKLRYQLFKKRMKFTERDVELWQSSTISHTDYTSEAKSITHTSRSYPKQENASSFESLLEEWMNPMQSSIVSKGLRKSTKRAVGLQTAN